MNLNMKIIMLLCFVLSILAVIYGYFLWTILIPIQDFHLMEDEEILSTQKELAINYPLGKFLMRTGSFGFLSSCIFLITSKVKKKIHTLKHS
ncbi:hypothetical protein JTF06_03060 [Desemzia sp. RIT804]|uniref:hypothetical protein n=1 Tax=Desemzia sp. RIT 804 TaxID=2810209 RepID=UPI0019500535|nr:hypothetical protein [Desemzia sp. RIT 804]MBM6613874.1 hypothetical protein [Desemzia sp. RIT 804]